MSDTNKSDIQPPVIVIDSYDSDNDADDETKKQTESNTKEETDKTNQSNSKSDTDYQLSNNSDKCDTQDDSDTNSQVTLQVPATLTGPVKSSLKNADGGATTVRSRVGHVTINLNQTENGAVKTLSRHGSRETLREEELQHLKEEVGIVKTGLPRGQAPIIQSCRQKGILSTRDTSLVGIFKAIS